jgi:hypothetical protein
MFTLNRCYGDLHIMDVKLCCDFFNMLVCSIISYACEVWVDFKKIEAIKVEYRKIFKSLFRARKTTNTSTMLSKFSKSPFEHFAWGQLLLYYNR